ncbi:MAG: hypothetical protein JWN52_6803 [Actinomycetia bacterium]|nr:hypothetical protein [Actinomycetes bacterium]
MTELNLLRDMRTQLAEPDTRRLATIRSQLTQHLAEPASSGRSSRPALGTRRFGFRVAVVGAAALALAAGITAVQIAGGQGAGPLRTQNAAAARLLTQAAVVAEADPGISPRPHQYVYTETRGTQTYGNLGEPGHEQQRTPYSVEVRDYRWERADGRGNRLSRQQSGRPVAVIPGTKPPGRDPELDNGEELVAPCGEAGPLAPTYAWAAALPTDPVQLRRTILTTLPHQNDRLLWQSIAQALQQGGLPPKLRATLFRVAAGIPGVRVIGNVPDALGRRGVAIGLAGSFEPNRDNDVEQLLFDPQSHRYLGDRSVLGGPRQGLPAGTVWSTNALVRVQVVDRLPKLQHGTSLTTC